MTVDPAVLDRLLNEHHRPIAHMRERFSVDRFGLVIGAGVSRGLGFPTWSKLIDRIAQHPDVDAGQLPRVDDSASFQSQLLFEHFRSKEIGDEDTSAPEDAERQIELEVKWKQIVHNCLYDGTVKLSWNREERPRNVGVGVS